MQLKTNSGCFWKRALIVCKGSRKLLLLTRILFFSFLVRPVLSPALRLLIFLLPVSYLSHYSPDGVLYHHRRRYSLRLLFSFILETIIDIFFSSFVLLFSLRSFYFSQEWMLVDDLFIFCVHQQQLSISSYIFQPIIFSPNKVPDREPSLAHVVDFSALTIESLCAPIRLFSEV